jgi:hypothetical protein
MVASLLMRQSSLRFGFRCKQYSRGNFGTQFRGAGDVADGRWYLLTTRKSQDLRGGHYRTLGEHSAKPRRKVAGSATHGTVTLRRGVANSWLRYELVDAWNSSTRRL